MNAKTDMHQQIATEIFVVVVQLSCARASLNFISLKFGNVLSAFVSNHTMSMER